jgi:hypothetical protein
METAIQSYKVLTMVGKTPFSDGSKQEVGGEETDGAITKFNLGIIGMVALAAIASGSEYRTRTRSLNVNVVFREADPLTFSSLFFPFTVASMVLTASAIVDIACCCLYIIAPVAIVQKIKLSKLGTLRSQHNELRNEVNKLAAQNERLQNTNTKLDLQCTELQGVSAEYQALVKQRGAQVDRLLAIVKENGEIQAKIKKNLQTQVMQQAMDTILKSDTNEDFAISVKELPQFKLRMKGIPGVEFDEANFGKLFKEKEGELGLKDIMQLFHNLVDDIPENDNVFHLKPQALAPRKSFLGI